MIYSELDIRRITTANGFAAGQVYQRQGRVTRVTTKGDGQMTGRVRGSEPEPYTQTIELARHSSGTVSIIGHCSCPVGLNCKHVAAVLLDALRRRPPETSQSARTSPWFGAALEDMVPGPSPSGLPHELHAWLDDLGRAQETADETYPPGLAQRLVYVLCPAEQRRRMPRLGVMPISARLLKDGRFSDGAREYGLSSLSAGGAKFLRPSDMHILDGLARLKRDYGSSRLILSGDTGADLLAAMLATGRVRWLDVNGPALDAGETRPGRIAWIPVDEAFLRPQLETEGDAVTLNARPPVYIDPEAGRIGPVDTGLLPKVASALLDAPPVSPDHLAPLGEVMEQRMPALAALRPPEPGPPEVIEVAPVPCLRLHKRSRPAAVPMNVYGRHAYALTREDVALARLSFRYGPATIVASDARPRVTLLQGQGRRLEVRRDRDAEAAHRNTIHKLAFVLIEKARPGSGKDLADDFVLGGDDLAWFEFLYADVPRLTANGWRIEIDADFPHRLARSEGNFDAIVESSGIDWFEFDLGVIIDGERLDLIEPIVRLIGSPGFHLAGLDEGFDDDDALFLRLADGRVIGMPAARLVPIVRAIAEIAMGGVPAGGRLRLKPSDAASLAAFEEATQHTGLIWRGGEALRQMGRRLTATGGIPPVALPATFAATLRPYQAQGVAWLAFLREAGFGGVLADDMGLGKTVQALALIAIEKAAGRLDRPALVVAPTSLMANWHDEAHRFAPDLAVLTLHGLDRRSRFGDIPASDVVLTTYPLIARDHETLGAVAWHMIILDEAQTIKNPDAATTKLVAGLEARHRFCLSGTPLENNLGELWSLFSFVMPGFLGDRKVFGREWRTPIEKNGDAARGKVLARKVRPFMLRRTKEEVERDLPPKTEIVERIEFGQAQRDLYESIRLSMHGRVRDAIARHGFAQSRIVILDALLKLRQVCCDPHLVKTAAATTPRRTGSAKLERFEEMIAELAAEKRRTLVFSQFTSMLDLIRPRLDALDVPYGLLTGKTRDRATQVRRFQEGKTPVFLVSLKAGGTGLNLTAADTVILYDPWWNPAAEDQAVDRAHRIGQSKPIFVHKLVATGTIEEKMEVLKARKRALAESLFDHDGAPTLAMTETDLDLLFAA